MKNAIPNLPNPRMVLEKNGKTNFCRYGPKDFAEEGIFEISQGRRVLGPPIGWGCLMALHFSPCSYPPDFLAPSSPGAWYCPHQKWPIGNSLYWRYFNFSENWAFFSDFKIAPKWLYLGRWPQRPKSSPDIAWHMTYNNPGPYLSIWGPLGVSKVVKYKKLKNGHFPVWPIF